ncbi:spore coat protein [Bacillus sp. EB01]|uniref:spore coat protein n=1 Tax=Bacillus sp. EB01 TaxID=1347086 RepID=UPI0005C67BEB|nr:spore coat protein [Bacillus sp. EB01]
MSNSISNPETKVEKNPSMNDRDFINDLLTTEKYMTDGYNVFMNEASHSGLYNDVLQIFKETQDCQRHLYNVMFQEGWYKVEPAQNQALQQKAQQFEGYRNQLPNHGGGQMQ